MLTQAIDAAVTSFTVADASIFPVPPFRITIDNEIMEVGAKDNPTNTFSSVLRGQEETTAASHANDAVVENRLTAGTYGELATQASLDAHLAETAQAHGDHDSQDVLLIRDAAGKLTDIDIKKPDDTGVSRITATLSFDANGRLSSALEKEFDVDGTTVKSQATTTILRDANGRITELEVR